MHRIPIAVLVCVILLAGPSFLNAVQVPGGGLGGSSRSGVATRRGARTATRAIQGQVISGGIRRLDHPIAVNLVTLGVVRDTVYTDGNGNFFFDQLSSGEDFQISVAAPGFKPKRTDISTGPFSTGLAVIILESLETDEDPQDEFSAVDLRELLVHIPDEAVELFEQAAEDSEMGDHEEASERLEEAIAISPDYYRAQNALGVEYEALGRVEDAVRHFIIAKDLSPNTAAPVVSLGAIYLRYNDVQNREGYLELARASLDQAFDYLEDAVRRDPLSEFAQYYLGAAHYRTGAIDDALDRLNRALGLNPQFHDVRIMLFNVHLADRDYDRALSQLTSYLELYPDSPRRAAIEETKDQLERQLGER